MYVQIFKIVKETFTLFGIVGMVGLLAACGNATITTPADTSAHNLDVVFIVSPIQIPGMLGVSASFAYQGVFVQFAHGEHVVCNGVTLHFVSNDFSANIPDVPANHDLSCSYLDARGNQTTVDFKLLDRPTILSPKAGATVARTKDFSISYIAESVSQVQANVDAFTSSDKAVGVTCLDSHVQGNLSCDITSLPPGPGQIQLIFSSDVRIPDTGFHSARLSLDSLTNVNVTWT